MLPTVAIFSLPGLKLIFSPPLVFCCELSLKGVKLRLDLTLCRLALGSDLSLGIRPLRFGIRPLRLDV